MKLGIISLGCAKNKVDSETFLGICQKYNIEITNDISQANIIVVNTCGFIESAKKEAIDTILEVIDYKKNNVKIIAMGCLVERYLEDLKKLIPEVDIYLPIRDYKHIDDLLNKLTKQDLHYQLDNKNRILSTTQGCAYVKIAEGCDNKCSYCAIPLIRGKFRSRQYDDIIEECKILASNGIKEITLIAQDTTRFGSDYQTDPRRLHNLLHDISLIDSIKWIRLLYLYPDEITDEILNEIANNDKVVKYFDIPIQHCSNRLLKLMNRRGSKELIRERINKIRSLVDGVIVRTTLIIGFPSETTDEVNELIDFIKEIKFERLGAFGYSKEEDTTSFDLPNQVSKAAITRRLNKVLVVQKEIAKKYNESLVSTTTECIVEGYDYERLCYYGRDYRFSPEESDGKIYIYSSKELPIGSFVKVKILEIDDYDLMGKYINDD